MNEKKINQILKNQVRIMAVLRDVATDHGKEGYLGSLDRAIEKTKELLIPKETDLIKEKIKEAMSGDAKRSK